MRGGEWSWNETMKIPMLEIVKRDGGEAGGFASGIGPPQELSRPTRHASGL
jgi:hypothetical protein